MVFQGMGFLLLLLPVCSYKDQESLYGNFQMQSYPWLEEMIKSGDLMDSFMWNAGLFHFLARTAHCGKTIDWNPLIPLLFSKYVANLFLLCEDVVDGYLWRSVECNV